MSADEALKRVSSFIVGNVYVLVAKQKGCRKPILAVQFKGEDVAYKVASFNDNITAEWFFTVLKEAHEENEQSVQEL